MLKDFAKLQGEWTLASLEMDGEAAPAGGGIAIDGDRFRAEGMGGGYAGTIELDETARPRHIDLIFTEGPEAGNINRGIYELSGDTFRLCLNMAGKARPRSFSTKAGNGNALEVFRRGAGVASAPPEQVVTRPYGEGELVGEWEMVEGRQSGHRLDPGMVKTARRITSDTHTTTYFGAQVYLNASYTIDAAVTPKRIDLVNRGKEQLGIYEVQGDILRICFAAPGKPRPTDFEARAGDGRTSAVWRRVSSGRRGRAASR